MHGSPFCNKRGDSSRPPARKNKDITEYEYVPGRKQQNGRNVAPARIASNFGLAFDRNRVVEGLGFSNDGSAGRLVGLQAEAKLLRGGQVLCGQLCGQTVALRVGLSASGF